MTSSAKRRTLFAIYVVFLLVLVEGALQVGVDWFDSELMQHGGFEEDEDVRAWGISNAAVARVPKGAAGQAVSIRSLHPNSYIFLDVETPLHVGEVYTLSFYVKSVESPAEFSVIVYGDQWSDIQGSKSGTATTSFAKHQLTFECTTAEQPTVVLNAPKTARSQTLVYDEISVRRVRPDPFDVALKGVGLTNPETHHELTPNRRFVTEPPEGYFFEPTLNEINSYGVRGPEINSKRAYRVLFIGDSFIEADEVSFSDTFGERLNRHFGPVIEFIAHGVSSWAPTTEFSWIHHRGMALQPDEIYLFTYYNDFYEWRSYPMSDQAYGGQAVWEAGVPVRYVDADARRALDASSWYSLDQWGRATLTRFELPRLLYGAYQLGKGLVSPRLTNEQTQILLAQDPSLWPRGLRSSVDETVEVIAALGRYLDERNVKLVVSLIPSPLGWKDEVVIAKKLSPEWQREFARANVRAEDFVLPQGEGLNEYLGETLPRRRIEWLDLWQALDAAKAERDVLLYHLRDGHWNRNGHQVVFELLRDRFLEHRREN